MPMLDDTLDSEFAAWGISPKTVRGPDFQSSFFGCRLTPCRPRAAKPACKVFEIPEHSLGWHGLALAETLYAQTRKKPVDFFGFFCHTTNSVGDRSNCSEEKFWSRI